MKKLPIPADWTCWKEGEEPHPVTLPHDAMIHDLRSPQSPSGAGGAYFVPGVYHYQKKLDIPEDWEGLHVLFRFDTVYPKAKVLLNGRELGSFSRGYLPFSVCADRDLRPGEENTLEVVADNSQMDSADGYTGAGMFRPAYILTGPEKYSITEENILVTTESLEKKAATVRVRVHDVPEDVTVRSEIFYKKRRIVEGTGKDCRLKVPDPLLWSETGADLYKLRVSLVKEDRTLDSTHFNFGIRTLEWNREGLLINGFPVKLRGGCVRHDNGILGACSTKEAENRKILLLKDCGFNAVHVAHTFPSEEFLTACDRYGMYAVVEGGDIESWPAAVIAARNHPCVIMYCLGKELVSESPQKCIDTIHQYDTTRPITSGTNPVMQRARDRLDQLKVPNKKYVRTLLKAAHKQSASLVSPAVSTLADLPVMEKDSTPLFDLLDIAGYIYGVSRYSKDRERYPERLITGMEIFPGSLYDAWKKSQDDPGLIGDFVWSAWDYLGQAAGGTWNTEGASLLSTEYPWLINGSGAFDILGNPTSLAYYASAVWGFAEKPWIGVSPMNRPGKTISRSPWRDSNAIDSWSWRGCTHYKTTVEVYAATGSFVKLILNDETAGFARLRKNKAVFHILYHPGVLTAVVYDSHLKEISTSNLRSAEGKLRISALPEQPTAFSGDVVYIPIALRGENGVVESDSDEKIKCTVENGKLLGFGSARPRTEESFCQDTTTTWYGRALAAVRVGTAGTTTVTFSSAVYQEEPMAVKIHVL